MKKIKLVLLFLIILLVACQPVTPTLTIPVTGKGTGTPTATQARTLTPHSTNTIQSSLTVTALAEPTIPPAITQTPDTSLDNIAAYPDAPLCADTGESHDNSLFHTLWSSSQGCHYDHEHGNNPFTPEVSAALPGFDLYVLLGNVGIGHTNPSSPMENTHKHGGWKWDVMLANPHGCLGGFESALWCIKASVIGYHAFGNYAIEIQARQHSAVYLLLVCNPANQADCGTIFVGNLEDYGQRISPYQGTIIYTIAQGCTIDNACPVNPVPSYEKNFGPYFTIGCIFAGLPGCRTSLTQAQSSNADSKWTSKLTGIASTFPTRPPGNRRADLLFDVRDTYQLLDSRDLTYPYTFLWLCTSDGGLTYNPDPVGGCKYNNTTTHVNEVMGVIPALWDNLAGFDTNPVAGRITAQGFVNDIGNIDTTCTVAGGSCYPIKVVNMFVGKYGDFLTLVKASLNTPANTPERDIYFCGLVVCSETGPGAVPSGWVSDSN